MALARRAHSGRVSRPAFRWDTAGPRRTSRHICHTPSDDTIRSRCMVAATAAASALSLSVPSKLDPTHSAVSITRTWLASMDKGESHGNGVVRLLRLAVLSQAITRDLRSPATTRYGTHLRFSLSPLVRPPLLCSNSAPMMINPPPIAMHRLIDIITIHTHYPVPLPAHLPTKLHSKPTRSVCW